MTTIYDLPIPENREAARSDALAEHIRHVIDQQGGTISFADFMALALYHPALGYYNANTFTLGREGDFTTAPEISPLFAACLAKPCAQLLQMLPQGDLLELGAGTGRLACDLLTALEHLGTLPAHYYIYEISPTLRQRQQHFIQQHCPRFYQHMVWLEQLPDHFAGILIANEVFDALPVHCFYLQEHGIQERAVRYDKQQFHWQLRKPSSELLLTTASTLQQQYQLPEGYTSELRLTLAPYLGQLANALTQGVMLIADYGYAQQEYYHPERCHGTLTCFYRHHRHDNPLILPGLQDITAHVDFTQVIAIAAEAGCHLAGYTTQAAFLLECGLLTLAAELEKTLGPADAFRLHQAIKTLTLPSEMGERIKIMAISKNIAPPLLGFQFSDRSHSL